MSATCSRSAGDFGRAYRRSDVQYVVHVDHLARPPLVLKKILDNPNSLTPDKAVVSLQPALVHIHTKAAAAKNTMRRTSENAEATILRWCFHSSPSVEVMFVPNTRRTA